MRNGVLILLVLMTFTATGGGSYSPSIDIYDSKTGFYYKSINKAKKSGLLSGGSTYISNINIYNPFTMESKQLFPSDQELHISNFLFEVEVKDKTVVFHKEYSNVIKNNSGIAQREPKDRILIVSIDPETNGHTLYSAKKDGTNFQVLKELTSKQEWHIDVKNSVIRIVTQMENRLSIENIEW
jgi:uncharacterized protein YkvS